jgi:hypothetical protein
MSEVSEAIREVDKALSPQIEDIKNASTVSCLILSVCLIDTLSGFMTNEKKVGKRFKAFTERYLPEHKDYLYEIRNAIVHSFTNPDNNFMFVMSDEFFQAYPHLEQLIDKKIFNVLKFKEALINAYNLFLQDVGDLVNQELRENFMNRYKKSGIIKDGMIGVMRNLQGKIVSQIDDFPRLPGLDVPFGIADTVRIKR